jgi:hypothetical protein
VVVVVVAVVVVGRGAGCDAKQSGEKELMLVEQASAVSHASQYSVSLSTRCEEVVERAGKGAVVAAEVVVGIVEVAAKSRNADDDTTGRDPEVGKDPGDQK